MLLFVNRFLISVAQFCIDAALPAVKEGIVKEYPKEYLLLLKEFVDYVCDKLDIIDRPKIKILNNSDFTQQFKSFGGYVPGTNSLAVVIKGRALADVLRTLAHELVHAHQMQMGTIDDYRSGETGSFIENEANMLAGIIMRDFGKEHPQIFVL